MPADAVLLSVYALLLLGVAHGLLALGRRSTSPWASRTLAGHLRATGDPPEPVNRDDWPHNEVPRLYAGIGLTAAVAGAVVAIGGLWLQHETASLALLVAVLSLSVLTALRLGGSLWPSHDG